MSTPSKGGMSWNLHTPSKASPFWQFTECLTGGSIAVGLFVVLLPPLVDLTQPLGLLSTTGLFSGFLVLWVLCWSLLGTVRAQVTGTTN